MNKIIATGIVFIIFALLPVRTATAQGKNRSSALDEKVKAFLAEREDTWQDLNVPEADGRLLYNLVVKNGYKKALEIGTSTGHSAIWIAWALSKTGGRLITIEIDEDRHRQALSNFKAAGLADYIDARLADAHDLVKELKGPFDFIFCDADKGWYLNYFLALYPKLQAGGCYAAHNVSERRWGRGAIEAFYDHVKSLPDMETTIDDRGAGMSISYKKPRK